MRIQAKVTFEPEKINTFNKDCRRGGKDVTCMSAIVCISLDARTQLQSHGVGVFGLFGHYYWIKSVWRVSVCMWFHVDLGWDS